MSQEEMITVLLLTATFSENYLNSLTDAELEKLYKERTNG